MSESVKTYLELLSTDPATTADYVNTLLDCQRVALREALAARGCRQLVRNLYYNYETQRWID